MTDDATTQCMNCRAELRGKFCSVCGQKDFGTRVDLKELVGEFVGETFEIEGRLPRTVLSVILTPGLYAAEYLEGKRRRYSSPLRFYLLAVFLCVVVTGWRVESATRAAVANGNVVFAYDPDRGDFSVTTNEDLVLAARQESLIQETNAILASTYLEVSPPADHHLPWWPECEPEVFGWIESMNSPTSLECVPEASGLARIGLGMRRLIRGREGPEILLTLVAFALEQTPLAMSAMVGVFAVLLKLFFWRDPATVHLIVAVTFHGLVLYGVMAFMFVPTGWMLWVIHGWLQTHALFSLKLVYGRSWRRTFVSYLVLGLLWLPLALGAVALGFCIGLYRIAGLL